MAATHVAAHLANIYTLNYHTNGNRDEMTPVQGNLVLINMAIKGVLGDRKCYVRYVGRMLLTTFSSPTSNLATLPFTLPAA